jgi:hypothetical protein
MRIDASNRSLASIDCHLFARGLIMPSDKTHDGATAPHGCPPLGTPEYMAYVERQSQDAKTRALNGHPILRVGSTVILLFGGIGGLCMAWDGLMTRSWWKGVPAFIVLTICSIRLLAHLRYSWGPVPKDTH